MFRLRAFRDKEDCGATVEETWRFGAANAEPVDLAEHPTGPAGEPGRPATREVATRRDARVTEDALRVAMAFSKCGCLFKGGWWVVDASRSTKLKVTEKCPKCISRPPYLIYSSGNNRLSNLEPDGYLCSHPLRYPLVVSGSRSHSCQPRRDSLVFA
jgi:hypothetical protein